MSKLKRVFMPVCAILFAGLSFYLYHSYLPAAADFERRAAGGPARLAGRHDINNSPYFAAPDVYNLSPTDSLTILTNFKTRQQETEYTCGPAAAAMVVEHFLKTVPHTEQEIAAIMKTNKFNGTGVKGMSGYFESLGWRVKSSLNSNSPANYGEFLAFVKANLSNNTPIIVENVELGGHWRVIIGYDTMGTEYDGDDVLLMADPYDTSDHLQDGYSLNSAAKFYYMWFDAQLFSSAERKKPWLTAHPR